MHHDDLTSSVDVERCHLVGVHDHQMGLEHDVGKGATALHDVGTDGEVGHEHAVHHVPVDSVAPGSLEGGDLIAETGEVGGQNRWTDFDRAHHDATLPESPVDGSTDQAGFGWALDTVCSVELRVTATSRTGPGWPEPRTDESSSSKERSRASR